MLVFDCVVLLSISFIEKMTLLAFCKLLLSSSLVIFLAEKSTLFAVTITSSAFFD
jgi:hypothetical protein